jgi:hypothetical protein
VNRLTIRHGARSWIPLFRDGRGRGGHRRWKAIFSPESSTTRNQRRFDCELRAAGQLGNLLLPKKLYEFIGAEITNGHSSTPSDVVVAAMPYLKAPATP